MPYLNNLISQFLLLQSNQLNEFEEGFHYNKKAKQICFFVIKKVRSQIIKKANKMSKVPDQSQLYHFTLVFLCVKMKVKFPCKLNLQHAGQILTDDFPPKQQNKFIINSSQIILKQQSSRKQIQIIVNLITQKGSKYISGLAKLTHNQLLRSQGQKVVIALTKCLDPDAYMQLRVEKVVTQKTVGKKNALLTGSSSIKGKLITNNNNSNNINNNIFPIRNNEYRQQSVQSPQPLYTNNFRSAKQLTTTRSQAQFNINSNNNINNPLKTRRQNDQMQQQVRPYCGSTGYYTRGGNSPPRTQRKIQSGSKSKMGMLMKQQDNINKRVLFDEQNTVRQKLIQAQVYKQNYTKLKEKYRKQSQNYKLQLTKRMALQSSENNYKLQIVRLRLKCEELQRATSQKTNKLKQLQQQVTGLKHCQSESIRLKEQLIAIKQKVQSYEHHITQLRDENQHLNHINKQIEHQYQTRLMDLQSECQQLKRLYEQKQIQKERETVILKQEIINLEYQLNLKAQTLHKQKQHTIDAQRSSQAKLFEFDTILNAQRGTNKSKLQELTKKCDKLQTEIKQLIKQKKQLQQQRDCLKGNLMKSQCDYKLNTQEINTLKDQLDELYIVKDKYNKLGQQNKALTIQMRALKQQKQHLTQSMQRVFKTNQSTNQEMLNQHIKELDMIKKTNLQITQSNKQLKQKLEQSQSLVQRLKIDIQKLKKSLQQLNKQYSELKQKQRHYKKSNSDKEQHLQQLTDKLQKTNNKYNTLIQSKKIQQQKSNNIITKLKVDLQQQTNKHNKLLQVNSQLTHQMNRVKMMLQFSQDKLQKTNLTVQQKHVSFQEIIQEHQGVIVLMQETIDELKQKQNQLINSLNMLTNQHNLVKQDRQYLIKENKLSQQKILMLQTMNKQKHIQINTLQNRLSSLQQKNQLLQVQIHKIKTELSIIKGDKQKGLKLLQIGSLENQKLRDCIVKIKGELVDKQGKIENKGKEINKMQQEVNKMSYSIDLRNKEIQQFKSMFIEVLQKSVMQNISIRQQRMNILGDNNNNNTKRYSSNSNNNIMQLIKVRQYPNSISNINSKTMNNNTTTRSLLQLVDTLRQVLTKEFIHTNKQNVSIITRSVQQSTKLNRQLERLRLQLSQSILHEQSTNKELTQQINKLQQQSNNTQKQHQQQRTQYQDTIIEFKQQLQHKTNTIQQISSQLDQLQFTLSSHKMNYQRDINELQKDIYHLNSIITEMQQKNQYQHNLIVTLQQKNYQLQKDIVKMSNTIIQDKQVVYLKENTIKELNMMINELQQKLKQQKHTITTIQTQLNNTIIQLTTIKQQKLTLQASLTQQQIKKQQLKTFSANLIKQKEVIIKQELQSHQQLALIENALGEVENHKRLLLAEIEEYKQEVNVGRVECKRLGNRVKQLQDQLSNQKILNNNKQLSIKQQLIKIQQRQTKIKQLSKTITQKQAQHKQIINELNTQIKTINAQNQKHHQQSNQKICVLQQQLKQYQTNQIQLKSHTQQLQQHLYSYRDKTRLLQQTILSLQHQINQLKYKTQHIESINQQIQHQSKDKQQQMYSMSANIYQLQNTITLIIKQKQIQFQELNNQWQLKYDQLCHQLQQRFQLIQKEKLYLSEHIVEKNSQVNKISEQKHQLEQQLLLKNQLLVQKQKKHQQQRILLLSNKNIQLNKLTQQLKHLFQTNKKKQLENKKISHQLDIAKNQIHKLDQRLIENQNKIKSINKMYQLELQEIKKKQLMNKTNKEELENHCWNAQRQVRKALQNFTKTILALNQSQKNKTELIQNIKLLENAVIAPLKIFEDNNNKQ